MDFSSFHVPGEPGATCKATEFHTNIQCASDRRVEPSVRVRHTTARNRTERRDGSFERPERYPRPLSSITTVHWWIGVRILFCFQPSCGNPSLVSSCKTRSGLSCLLFGPRPDQQKETQHENELRIEKNRIMIISSWTHRILLLATTWTTLLLLFGSTPRTSAFILPSSSSPSSSPSSPPPPVRPTHHPPVSPFVLRDFTSTGWDSFERIKKGGVITDFPSGERQRKYRRTVYTHDDWKKHRSQDRFLIYLKAILTQGAYQNLAGEVTLTASVAVVVCLYNALVGGYDDLNGVSHAAVLQSQYLPQLGLPLSFFTLTSPSLGLLLGTYLHILGLYSIPPKFESTTHKQMTCLLSITTTVWFVCVFGWL